MARDYSEDRLVQKTAADFMKNELGWESVYAFDTETFGPNGTFGRKDKHEVVLFRYLRKALKKLNPWITDSQVSEAESKLTEWMASQTLMQINEQKYKLIRDGVSVTIAKPNGETEQKTAKVIDFANPENNEFLCVRELWIDGYVHHRRADIVGFVNGLPLLFVELKNHDVAVKDAYTKNYRDYLDTIPHLFHHNAFVIFSNALEARIGTIESKWEYFKEWKRLSEADKGCVELETMLRGVCDKKNFLDLFENFLLYDHSSGRTAKILAQNHQYLGVNNVIDRYAELKQQEKNLTPNHSHLTPNHSPLTPAKKLGVFWHTQGSGKSYSMAFLSQKIRRKFEGSPTIVVLTDRDELNSQISETFENCGLLGEVKAKQFIARSGSDLVEKLRGNPSFIFSLIQKFNQPQTEPIYPDHDIIVMSDEAHRTQNGVFAENMMRLLPTASRIGFTGTPLLRDDNITERTFGGYVSIYDFKRAIDDKATVPLLYENRGEKLQELENPDINDEIAAALETAGELDASQLAKLEKEFSKEVHLLTAEKRLRIIAHDFVRHYSDLWATGKAMMVSYNKVTCVRMYNYVQEYWAKEIKELEKKIAKTFSQQEVLELQRKLDWLQKTEMAVVISQEQNEIDVFRKWKLDIIPHREKMEKRKLDKEFKDADSNLRVVFVCAMWLTGFDVPTLSCLYLDKPMKAHTLMQTIARANRVAEGKTNGLIIDYIGIVKALRKALADYTSNPDGTPSGNDPTIPKEELLDYVNATIADTIEFLNAHDFDINELIESCGFPKIKLIKKAANAMCETLEIRKVYCTYSSTLLNLWKYLDREEISDEMFRQKDAIEAIYKELNKKREHADITSLSVAINEIINEHLEIDYTQPAMPDSRVFDLSTIDFNLLRSEFSKSKEKNLILRELDELIQQALARMTKQNPKRVNFYEKYQKIISEYNNEQNRVNIEKTFEALMQLSDQLTEEQVRYIQEGFDNDEQLAMFDVLMKDNLSPADIKKLKSVARELLGQIKDLLATMDSPFDKPQTEAIIDTTIRNYLYAQLPESYDDNECNTYREAVFNFVRNKYGVRA